jgi:hypothetical protein
MYPTSALYRHFSFDVFLPNIYIAFNIIPITLGAILSANIHLPNEYVVLALVELQWFFIGYVVSVIVQTIKKYYKNRLTNHSM